MSPWPAPERRTWRPRAGILRPSELSRALRDHPGWRLEGGRLVRELRFPDFDRAYACVSVLVKVEDFHRHPDVCIVEGNRVRVTIGNPHHVGVTVAELRLVDKVEAALARSAETKLTAPDAPRDDREYALTA